MGESHVPHAQRKKGTQRAKRRIDAVASFNTNQGSNFSVLRRSFYFVRCGCEGERIRVTLDKLMNDINLRK